MPSNFDRDIKHVPLFRMDNRKRIRRALTLTSSADNETGVNSAKPNRYGHQ
jgi:hypothetical protein